MKAVVINKKYGSNLLYPKDIDLPLIKPNQLLVKVHASSVNPVDYKAKKLFSWLPMSDRFEKMIGSDFAGEVIQTGDKVKNYKPGDEVFGMHIYTIGGAYAEFLLTFENYLYHKPGNIDFNQAAAVPMAGLTALQGLRNKGHIEEGKLVLIIGATGGVGHFAVQIAKYFGAEVTAVCSTANVDLAYSLGAGNVIDYKKEDYLHQHRKFDIIFDVAGKNKLSDFKHIIKKNGRHISTLALPSHVLDYIFLHSMGRKRYITFLAWPNPEDLKLLHDLIVSGVIKPLVSSVFPLERAGEAHEALENHKTYGKIVIAVE